MDQIYKQDKVWKKSWRCVISPYSHVQKCCESGLCGMGGGGGVIKRCWWTLIHFLSDLWKEINSIFKELLLFEAMWKGESTDLSFLQHFFSYIRAMCWFWFPYRRYYSGFSRWQSNTLGGGSRPWASFIYLLFLSSKTERLCGYVIKARSM